MDIVATENTTQQLPIGSPPNLNGMTNENIMNGGAAPAPFILAPGGERALANGGGSGGAAGQSSSGGGPGSAKLVMDYTTDFPELPPPTADAGGAQPGGAMQTTPAWTKAMPKILSSRTTQVFHLPAEERAMLDNNKFGSNNSEQEKCNEIAQKTGTTIELSDSKDRTLTVMMTGVRGHVEEARKLVVQQLQTQARKRIHIPKDNHRVLIGQAGKRLRELEAMSNCRIQIPGRADLSEDIEVTGPKEGIEKALHEIQLISDEQSKKAQEHLMIPRTFYPWIRGPDAETLHQIQSETGARVNIPPQFANSEVIVVTGEKEGVYKAAAMIKAIYEKQQAVAKAVTCKVAKAQHRYVIGPNRSGLADVLRQTDVSVEVPPEDADSDTITLRGPADRLGEALSLVYAKASSVITAEIPCPLWFHRYIIGHKGSGLQQMGLSGAENKVQVTFEDSGVIYLEGPPEAVKSAHEKLSGRTIDLQREMDFQVVKVAPVYHRHIIGKQGALIGKIKAETGCTVVIPDAATNSDQIRIEGKKEGVAKAANEIIEIAKRLENEKTRDILIESRFHKQIIGAKGETIQKIRDQFPNCMLSFPEPGRKSDVVNLRGPKDELDKCYKHLQALNKELLENNFQSFVPVFKEFHKNIIGKGGATIRKIREDTQTRIDLPAEGSDESAIAVIGKKANVEKAVAELTRIQNELASIITQDLKILHKVQARLRSSHRLIKDIQDECGGVHIRFAAPEKASSDKVTIRGPKDDVEKAAKILLDLAKDAEVSSFEDNVKAKPELHRFIIGKGGVKIKKLKEQFTDVRILFPRMQDQDQDTIHLIGREADVGKVKEQLEKMVQEMNEITETFCDVPMKWHRHFVQRGAAVINEIQDNNGGVIISFPKPAVNSTRVLVKGAKDCCESAKKRIEEIVNDLEAAISMTVSIPQEHHRVLLGNRGAKIQAIQADCNVHIRFSDPRRAGDAGGAINTPPRMMANGVPTTPPTPGTGEHGADEQTQSPEQPPAQPQFDPNAVTVNGRPEDCERAKERLLALVPQSEVLAVPYEYHGALIGKRGEGIRKLMQDHDVHINIPNQDLKMNEIEIIGVADRLQGAIADVMKMVEDWEARQFTLSMEVPAEYHQKLIGARGSTINGLRDKFDVNINIPRTDSETPDTITLVGHEAKCEECKAEIERLIGDLRSMFTQEISLDCRIHPRLIGTKRRSVKKIEDDYRVDIVFPRSNDPNPNLVTVSGKDAESVYDCVDYLRTIEEDYLQDVTDRYTIQRDIEPVHAAVHQQQLEMKNAPWSSNAPDLANKQEFPSMGAAGDASADNNNTAAPRFMGAWGRR